MATTTNAMLGGGGGQNEMEQAQNAGGRRGTAATATNTATTGPRGASSHQKGCSVVADDEQTHCALSGEKFEQFWDETHQEWRYKDAQRLTDEEAAQ